MPPVRNGAYGRHVLFSSCLHQAVVTYKRQYKKGKPMSELFIAVKTDEDETPLGVGKSLRELERKLGLKERSLEYCCYNGIPNKRLKLKVRRVNMAS